MSTDVVFLLDVDNTLLDGDRIVNDLRDHLGRAFGVHCARSSGMSTTWAPFSATGSTSTRAAPTSIVC